jgi:hypothetical protein
MERELSVPGRPEFIDADVWYFDQQNYSRSVQYTDLDGGSPDFTNHLSRITFDIVFGAGSIATQGMIAQVEAGSRVTIMPVTRYSYVGKMSMLVTAEPAIVPAFITIGNAKLGRNAQKVLHKIERQRRVEQRVEKMLGLVNAAAGMATLESWYAASLDTYHQEM